MTFTIRSTTPADLEIFVTTLHAAFGRFAPAPEEDGSGVFWAALEMERNLMAVTGAGVPIGTAAAYALELTVPGGARLPAAGITNVGVLPSHRRRGVMTALVGQHLTAARSRGECLSVLAATEATIYRRLGYGPATFSRRLAVTRHRAAFAATAPPVGGSGGVEVLLRSGCGDVLADVYDRYRRGQPGALERPARFWDRGAGRAPVSREQRYVAVHRNAEGLANGYASYALEGGTLTVDESIATDDAAQEALDRFVLGHDLVERVVFSATAPDHPLRWQLTDLHAVESSGDEVWLWVRLLDVPAALIARTWASDGELVLHVEDEALGERQTLLLAVQDGRARCTPTTRAADLVMGVDDLGSLYLGGVAPSALVRAGRVTASSLSTVHRADAVFRAARAPFCCFDF